jgi:hypothetical protein
MTSRRLPCQWALLLFLYIAFDFMDPSIPGVFFFDSDELFVDGVVQLKSHTSRDLAATEPTAFGRSASYAVEKVAVTTRFSTRPSLSRQTHWKNVKHDDSASLGSASPTDSSPDLPSST